VRPFSAREVLDICDQGHGHGTTAKALLLLAAASPEATWEDLAALPVGERDQRLLALRESTLGPRLEALARCPACGETVELALESGELRVAGADRESELCEGGLSLRFRPVDSADLLAIEECADPEAARRRIAERSLLAASRDGQPIEPRDLSPQEVGLLAEALAEADPGAELLLELRCPACGHAWRELFDPAVFFWAELESRSQRLLLEIHVLARAYGWREADVLALNPRRRRAYLELLGA
jgi:hypothetical protein